jgi:hypothetical protein
VHVRECSWVLCVTCSVNLSDGAGPGMAISCMTVSRVKRSCVSTDIDAQNVVGHGGPSQRDPL